MARNPNDRLKELKLRQLELLEAKQRYEQTHALEFAQPQPQQLAAFNALQDPKISTVCVLGGNRSGKSFWLAASICSFALGRFPWVPRPPDLSSLRPQSIKTNADGTLTIDGQIYDNEKHFKEAQIAKLKDLGALRFNKGSIKIRVLGEDYEKAIGQVLLPYFFKFIPPEKIVGKRKGQTGVYNQIVVDRSAPGQQPGSVLAVIDFLTYAQGSEVMEGWDGHLVAYDEPPPRSVFIANQRGLVDHRGISLFAMTPLKEPWIAEEVVNNPDQSIVTFTFKSHENPHIDKTALMEFEKKLSEDERETRIEGKFLHLQGLVFKEFNKQIHVVPAFDIPKNYTVYAAIDTHPRTQQAVLFVAVDAKDRKWVIHELFQHGTPDEVADWIINFNDKIRRIHRVIIEPASQGDTNRGDSTYQIIDRRLAEEQIPLDLGSKDLSGGILQVKEHFKSANGQPSLWIFDRCVHLIKELTNYVWDDWKYTGQTDRSPKQKPIDRGDHLVECLRRTIQHPATYCDPRHFNILLGQVNGGYRPTDPVAGY